MSHIPATVSRFAARFSFGKICPKEFLRAIRSKAAIVTQGNVDAMQAAKKVPNPQEVEARWVLVRAKLNEASAAHETGICPCVQVYDSGLDDELSDVNKAFAPAREKEATWMDVRAHIDAHAKNLERAQARQPARVDHALCDDEWREVLPAMFPKAEITERTDTFCIVHDEERSQWKKTCSRYACDINRDKLSR